MKQASFILNVALALCLCAASANGITVTWISAASGNWSNPANWSPNQVPGTSDTAVITASGNYTVTLDETANVEGLILGANDGNTQTLELSGQTLNLIQQVTVNPGGLIDLSSGTLNGYTFSGGATINGTLTCSGGSLAGVLTLATNSILNLSGPSSPFNSLNLFTNYGTVNWGNVNLELQSSPQIYNYGLWVAATNNTFYGASGGGKTTFYNYGTFRKNGGTIAAPNYDTFFDNNTTFNNFGTLDDEIGAIVLSYGYGGGIVNTTTNVGLGLALGNFTVAGDMTFAGTGPVQGNFLGDNAVIHGSMTLDYGSFSGTLTVASNSTVNLVGILGESTPIGFNALTLTNYGTVVWSNLNLECQSESEIDNYGLWDIQTNNEFYGAFSGDLTVFNNHGLVRKDAGTIGPPNYDTFFDDTTTFNNYGTLDDEIGAIVLSYGYGGGIVNTTTNVGLGLALGDFTVVGDMTFTGAGPVQGTFLGDNGAIHGSMIIDYGSFSGTLTVANDGVVTLAGILGETTPIVFNELNLTNDGTILWSNLDIRCQTSAQIYNYALWDAEANNTFYGVPGSNTNAFNNYGTFRKDGGTIALPNYDTFFDDNTTFNNYGTLDDEIGAIILSYGYGGGVVNTTTNVGLGLALGNFTVVGDMTFTGPGPVQGSFLGNNGVIHGSMTLDYGSFSGTLTVASNSTVNLVGILGETTPIVFNTLTLTNYGTVIWSNLDLDCDSGVEVYNRGLWDALTGNTFFGNADFGPLNADFNNYGTFRKGGDSSSANFDSNAFFSNFGTLDAESGGVSIFNGGGNGVFNAATNSIVWLGSFGLFGAPTFTGSGLMAGNLTGTNAVIHGVLNFYYGTLQGTLTVASNAVANLAQANGLNTPIILNGLTLTNCGTVIWSNLDLDCDSGPQVYNYGLWVAASGNTFYGNADFGPLNADFNNYGIFRKDGDSASVNFDSNAFFSNFGTLDAESGNVSIFNGGGNGVFNAAANSIVWLGNFGLFGGSMFTGSGLMAGNLTGTNAVIHGALNFYYGTLQGTLTVASNAVANLAGANGLNTPISLWFLTLTNCGTIVWSNLDLDCEGAQVCNHGLWDALTGNTFAGGQSMSVFNNYGTFRKEGDANSATFDSDTTFNNPGKTDVQNGFLLLEGACSLTNGTLNFGISGPGQAGTIYLANTPVLTGRLSANFENHYSPAVSNSFPVVEYSSETGMFTSLCLPHLPPALTWQTNYTSTTFTLSIVPAAPLQLSAGLNLSGHSMSLSWGGLSGQTYQVQCTTNLSPANWVNLGNSIPGTNGTITVSDPIGAAQKFYRIELQ